jgi:hypothetical protein
MDGQNAAALLAEIQGQRNAYDADGLRHQVAVRMSTATVHALGHALIPEYDPPPVVADDHSYVLGMPVEVDDAMHLGAARVFLRLSQPGVYDLSFVDYLADPVAGGSLSSSGARMLLAKTPAHFRHYQDHPEDKRSTAEMDFGSVAHDLAFGRGKGFVEVKADDWRTKLAKQARADAEAEGQVALLSKDVATVRRMAAALRDHPLAAALFAEGSGEPEQCIVWRSAPVVGTTDGDWVTRAPVWCRAMVDFLRHPTQDDTAAYLVPDYKTCESASTEDVMKAAERYGYHVQGEFYRRAVLSVPDLVRPGQPVRFALVAQEKTPPFLVNVVLPDADAMTVAARRVDEALALYARCRSTGEWPGYGTAANIGELPAWATRELRGEW